MELQIMYRKDYSALAEIQEPRSVQYLLITDQIDDLTLYGVQITEVGLRSAENGVYFPLTETREEAERVVTYLYENAVAAVHCVGVVNDLRSILAFDGGDRNGYYETNTALDCG